MHGSLGLARPLLLLHLLSVILQFLSLRGLYNCCVCQNIALSMIWSFVETFSHRDNVSIFTSYPSVNHVKNEIGLKKVQQVTRNKSWKYEIGLGQENTNFHLCHLILQPSEKWTVWQPCKWNEWIVPQKRGKLAERWTFNEFWNCLALFL